MGAQHNHHSGILEESIRLEDLNTQRDAHGRGWQELQQSSQKVGSSSGPFCWLPRASFPLCR